MRMSTIRRALTGGAFIAAALCLSAAPAGAGNGNSQQVGSGPDHVYAGGGAFAAADVSVLAGVLGQGNSQTTLRVAGVDAPAGTRFGAHVHQLPCGETGGAAGPHYFEADASGPLKNHEVWLDFSVDANGSGHAVATRQFEITDRANRSVIIHVMPTDPAGGAGARLVCVDLDS